MRRVAGGIVHRTPPLPPRRDTWWKEAVFYEVYLRSFFDSDGDGVGDLAGVTARLEHFVTLGVDAIWITPFFRSPMADFGYDVADYLDVDPLFGTLDDLRFLIAQAHALGLRVLIDFVPSHTSNRHPWFLEARESRSGPKANWYVFADPKPDGSPPNNWLSVFGGVAWEWEPRRGQYYLHNFLRQQPDLNWHEPAVREALFEVADFWFSLGVDGLRIDALEFGFHDPGLRNNPPAGTGDPPFGAGTPWAMQRHRWNSERPELTELFLKPLWRRSEERWGGRVLLGEVTGDRQLLRMAGHTAGGGLDLAYSFALCRGPLTARRVREAVETVERHLGRGWVMWAFSNHDVVRAVSRLGVADPPERARAMLPVLLASLRGSPCLYQGEELGLEEAALAFEDLRDPFGIAMWPRHPGRDGCRTPYPWSAAAPHGGFSAAEPWLRFFEPHRARALDRQQGRAGSVFERLRAFLAFRRRRRALRLGRIRFLDVPEPLLLFLREEGAERLVCAFNAGPQPAVLEDPWEGARAAFSDGESEVHAGRLRLASWGYLFLELPASGTSSPLASKSRRTVA